MFNSSSRFPRSPLWILILSVIALVFSLIFMFSVLERDISPLNAMITSITPIVMGLIGLLSGQKVVENVKSKKQQDAVVEDENLFLASDSSGKVFAINQESLSFDLSELNSRVNTLIEDNKKLHAEVVSLRKLNTELNIKVQAQTSLIETFSKENQLLRNHMLYGFNVNREN